MRPAISLRERQVPQSGPITETVLFNKVSVLRDSYSLLVYQDTSNLKSMCCQISPNQSLPYPSPGEGAHSARAIASLYRIEHVRKWCRGEG